MQHDVRRQSIQVKYDALLKNNTWELVPTPLDQEVIGCRWLHKTKLWYLMVLTNVSQACSSRIFADTWADYTNTFSLVVKATSIRLVSFLALHFGWDLRQLDINNTFANGDLEETIYMIQLPSYVRENLEYMCKLKKSL